MEINHPGFVLLKVAVCRVFCLTRSDGNTPAITLVISALVSERASNTVAVQNGACGGCVY
jgi:hypothetical protein